jgi:hypothetical protein
MPRHPILALYDKLLKKGKKGFLAPEVGSLLDELVGESYGFLGNLDRIPLVSRVAAKSYFSFQGAQKLSRPVNQGLFLDTTQQWEEIRQRMGRGDLADVDPAEVNRALYSAAMSFCAAVDLIRPSQKTPGTFFEYFVAFFFSWRAGVEPRKAIQVLSLEEDGTELPTDFVFDLGKDRPKFHMPIKTSSRERAIMLWAHQKLLDGVYGIERFLGIPVLLAETKKDEKSNEVVEICTPEQWRLYQTYIARLKRIYYLDMPTVYGNLGDKFPSVVVRPFGSFFGEWTGLISGG